MAAGICADRRQRAHTLQGPGVASAGRTLVRRMVVFQKETVTTFKYAQVLYFSKNLTFDPIQAVAHTFHGLLGASSRSRIRTVAAGTDSS